MSKPKTKKVSPKTFIDTLLKLQTGTLELIDELIRLELLDRKYPLSKSPKK